MNSNRDRGHNRRLTRREFLQAGGAALLSAPLLAGERAALTLTNDLITISLAGDASACAVIDRQRSTVWQLDRATLACRRSTAEYRASANRDEGITQRIPLPLEPLRQTSVTREGETLVLRAALPEGPIEFVWSLAADHVAVTLRQCPAAVEFATLPGVFYPSTGPHEMLIPVYQGVLCRKSGQRWEQSTDPGGHTRWSMAMGAMLAERSALLVTQESETDWTGTRGEGERGPFFHFEQRRCAIAGWYPRSVRLYPLDRSITAVCRRYRARVQERGEFVSWTEKIARKPAVKNLFGALMAFIGYNRTTEIDYIASAKKLKAAGFAKMFFYPVRMANYTQNFKMGGDDPIWFSDDDIRRLKAIDGAFVSPWAWTAEVLDDGTEEARRILRHNHRGTPLPGWKMDNFQWNHVCPPYEIETMQRRFAGDLREMDWVHYDVSAMVPGSVCFNSTHALHGRRPLGRRECLAIIRRQLGPETNGNRVVSSEGFVDRYTGAYDIGTTKLQPQWGTYPFIPVPMTMLVFHDSCVHDWWEHHNYNAHPGAAEERRLRVGTVVAGRAEQKAAMDALYGSPPNVFPFGRQYGWTDRAKNLTYSYLVRVEDAEVQRAIRAALPVARLHARTGMADLQSFEFLTPDCRVQKTEFANGTSIVANLSDQDAEAGGLGVIQASTWREL